MSSLSAFISAHIFNRYMEKISSSVEGVSLPSFSAKSSFTGKKHGVQSLNNTVPKAMDKADRQPLWVGPGRQPDLERSEASNSSTKRLSHLEDKRIGKK
jgi:hypothetical protein